MRRVLLVCRHRVPGPGGGGTEPPPRCRCSSSRAGASATGSAWPRTAPTGWAGPAPSTNQILGHFYPGTALGRASGAVRVAVHAAPGGDPRLSQRGRGTGRPQRCRSRRVPRPGRARRSGARPLRRRALLRRPPQRRPSVGGRRPSRVQPVDVATDDGTARPCLRVPVPAQAPPDPATTTTTMPPLLGPPPDSPRRTTTVPAPPPDEPPPPPPDQPAPPAPSPSSGRPLWAVPADGGTVALPARGRRYRGLWRPPARRVAPPLNEVDVEQYLRGMGEVRDPSWPAAALRAQAVAARTYALRAMAVAGELCDTQRCQVYLGADAEYGAMNKAVRGHGPPGHRLRPRPGLQPSTRPTGAASRPAARRASARPAAATRTCGRRPRHQGPAAVDGQGGPDRPGGAGFGYPGQVTARARRPSRAVGPGPRGRARRRRRHPRRAPGWPSTPASACARRCSP